MRKKRVIFAEMYQKNMLRSPKLRCQETFMGLIKAEMGMTKQREKDI